MKSTCDNESKGKIIPALFSIGGSCLENYCLQKSISIEKTGSVKEAQLNRDAVTDLRHFGNWMRNETLIERKTKKAASDEVYDSSYTTDYKEWLQSRDMVLRCYGNYTDKLKKIYDEIIGKYGKDVEKNPEANREFINKISKVPYQVPVYVRENKVIAGGLSPHDIMLEAMKLYLEIKDDRDIREAIKACEAGKENDYFRYHKDALIRYLDKRDTLYGSYVYDSKSREDSINKRRGKRYYLITSICIEKSIKSIANRYNSTMGSKYGVNVRKTSSFNRNYG